MFALYTILNYYYIITLMTLIRYLEQTTPLLIKQINYLKKISMFR